MNIENKGDFCLHIEFEKHSVNPSRIFRAASELIDSLTKLDNNLLQPFDIKASTVMTLEEIEIGSIKTWLKNHIEATNDEDIVKLNWKPLLGNFLVRSKYEILKLLDEKKEIKSREDVKQVEHKIMQIAKDTNLSPIGVYKPIKHDSLVESLSNVSSSLLHLDDQDKASFISNEGVIPFNRDVKIVTRTELEDFLTRETIGSERDMLLKVKKPDYLGSSMWDFKVGDKTESIKIADEEWLSQFQDRKIDIRPGDSIRATVRSEEKYGYNSELVATHFVVIKVLEVIPWSEGDQIALL